MNKFWYFRHILPFLWPKSVKEENKYHKFSLFIASHRWVHSKNRNPRFWRWTQNWRIEWNLTVVKSKTTKNNVWMSNAQLKLEILQDFKTFHLFFQRRTLQNAMQLPNLLSRKTIWTAMYFPKQKGVLLFIFISGNLICAAIFQIYLQIYMDFFFPYPKFLLNHIVFHFNPSFLVSVFSSQNLKRLLNNLLFY